MCRLYHQLVLKWNKITHGPTDGIKAMIMSLSHKSVIGREGGIVRGTTICVCLLRHECVFFLLLIDFEVKWYNLQSDK